MRLARQRPRRIGDRHRHPIARDLQVAGPLRFDHAAQHPVDRLRSRRGIVEDRRVDGHLAVDLQLALERLDDVVEMQLRPSQRDLGTTADDQEGRLLRIGTCDGIERVQRPGTIRHQCHAQPAKPRVGVGGEAHARLMGTDDRRHPDLLLHGVDGQHEVARDAERMPHAQLSQPMEQILGQVHEFTPDPYPAVSSDRVALSDPAPS